MKFHIYIKYQITASHSDIDLRISARNLGNLNIGTSEFVHEYYRSYSKGWKNISLNLTIVNTKLE